MSQLDDYLNAIKTSILAGVDATNLQCQVLEQEHGNPNNKLPLPLVLIGVSEMEQVDEVDYADRMQFEVALEAHCILPSSQCNDLHAMKFATEVTAVLNRNRFDLDFVNQPEQFQIMPGDFTNIKNGYESRVVQWRQRVTLDLANLGDALLPFLEVESTHLLSGTTEPQINDRVELDQ